MPQEKPAPLQPWEQDRGSSKSKLSDNNHHTPQSTWWPSMLAQPSTLTRSQRRVLTPLGSVRGNQVGARPFTSGLKHPPRYQWRPPQEHGGLTLPSSNQVLFPSPQHWGGIKPLFMRNKASSTMASMEGLTYSMSTEDKRETWLLSSRWE